MGSKSKPTAGRRSGSRRRIGGDRLRKSHTHRPISAAGAPATHSSLSDKLEALKQLIPSHNGEIKSDQLFQETAQYIVLLRTQVLVLQKMIDFYGSSTNNSAIQNSDQNAV